MLTHLQNGVELRIDKTVYTFQNGLFTCYHNKNIIHQITKEDWHEIEMSGKIDIDFAELLEPEDYLKVGMHLLLMGYLET